MDPNPSQQASRTLNVPKDARILRVIKILRIFKIVRILKAVKIVECVSPARFPELSSAEVYLLSVSAEV